MTEAAPHSVAVIGGGVVGCAVLRALSLCGLRPLMLERGADILSGASKGNSALLHTGYDAVPGSLELKCVRDGYDQYRAIHAELGLPLLETSAIMVAWTAEDQAVMPDVLNNAQRCGVETVRSLALDDLYRREPGLSPGAKAAILIPGEHVIDPWSAPLAYATQAVANGARILRGCEVTGGEFLDGFWRLRTGLGEICAKTVINCAGLFGDIVEAICRPSSFEIRPRKGQFVVFDKPAARHVSATILAVPNDRTKGVLVARTAFGNLLVGPTAEDQDVREFPQVETGTLQRLINEGERLVPALRDERVTATFAGLRPATQHKDYQIEAVPDRNWITVGGIRSTGLTGSLGIARHVMGLYGDHFGAVEERADPVWITVPNISEAAPRPWQQRGAGEIVCHCELVTVGEIEAALSSPVAATEIGGLRRRTRCMMGRCQGFYCTGRIADLTRSRIDPPLAELIGS